METTITTPDVTGFLEKLEASRAAKENTLRALERDAKALQKDIKDDDELIRVLRSRLNITNPEKKSSNYGSKAEMLRKAIAQLSNQQFVQNDALIELKRANPNIEIDPAWLRTALWSLAKKQKLIKQISKGDSLTAALYEKVKSTCPPRRMVTNHHVNGSTGVPFPRADILPAFSTNSLEDFVRAKNRRMDEITDYFHVDVAAVKKLFKPASRVFEASRGWIKIQEQPNLV